MELRHLRTIVAVARHRSLTKAGEELYLSQSAVSQQIRRLEEELGIEVFRRTSRSVELTAEGRVILGYAERVLAEVDDMHSELEEITGLLSGQLRIGGVYPTGPYDLFGLLADFRAAHPGVAIHMVEDDPGRRAGGAALRRAGLRVRRARPGRARRRVRRDPAVEGRVRGRAAARAHALCAARDHVRAAGGGGPDRLSRELGAAPPARARDGRPRPGAAQRVRLRRRWRRCAGWRARASAWR